MNRPMLMMIGGAVLVSASLTLTVLQHQRMEQTRIAREAELREEAEATTVDAVPSLARTCWSSEPDYASGVELEVAEGRIRELERQLAVVDRYFQRSWPPIDVAHYLCVRWARDDPDALPVRVIMTPEAREQIDAILAERPLARELGDWVGATGCFRVVEVVHPRAVPIREAREGEACYRIAFVRPEPGERAEWEDPRR